METHAKMLQAVKLTGGILLTIGCALFMFSLFGNGYDTLTGISIGVIMGAVFIFLIGSFFVASEEMLEKRDKGIEIKPVKPRNGLYLVKR